MKRFFIVIAASLAALALYVTPAFATGTTIQWGGNGSENLPCSISIPLLPAINQNKLVKQQFFHGLKPDNQIEVRQISLETPFSALIKKLKEIERYSTQQILRITR
jgi:hypothetical protein